MNAHAIASQMLQDCKHLRKGSLVQQPLYVFYYQVNLREGCKKILVKDRSVYKIAQHLIVQQMENDLLTMSSCSHSLMEKLHKLQKKALSIDG